MTPDDVLLFVVVTFISGILGVGLGYYIRDVQVNEYIKSFDKNIEELNILADIIRKEKGNAD